jgi:hypothetical protein
MSSVRLEYDHGPLPPAIACWDGAVTGAQFDAIVAAAEKIIGRPADTER